MAKFKVTVQTPDGPQEVTVTANSAEEAAAVAPKIVVAKTARAERPGPFERKYHETMGGTADATMGTKRIPDNEYEFDGPGDKLMRLLDKGLSINDAFDLTSTAKELYGLEGTDRGNEDRFRHLAWMQTLAHKYGPEYALAAGGLHELQGLFDPVQTAIAGRKEGKSWEEIRRESAAQLREIPRDFVTNASAIAAINNPDNPSKQTAAPNINQLAIQAMLTDTLREPLTAENISGPVRPYKPMTGDELLAKFREYQQMNDQAMHPLAGMFSMVGKGPNRR